MLKLKQSICSIVAFLSSVESAEFCLKKIEPRIRVAPQELTVDEALNIAFMQRPSQQSFDYTIRAGKEHEKAALSGFFPQLTFQTRAGAVKRSILLPKKQVFIDVKQLLLSFSGPMDQYHIAQQETEISRAKKLLDLDNIRYETESTMLGLWDVQKKYDYIFSLGNSSKIVFQRDKHSNELGLLDTNAWLTALAQYALLTAQVSQYTDELNTAFANLERSLGIPVTETVGFEPLTIEQFINGSILAAQQHDSDYYYQAALNNRKELLQLDHQIEHERYLSNSYAKSYLPEVYLFGQIQYYAFKPLQNVSAASAAFASGANSRWVDWRVGLEFDWQFDSFGNAFNAESSYATMLGFQATRLDTVQQIKKEVHTTYDSLQRSLKDLDAQEVKFKQADNELTLRKKQHEIGDISDVEMAQAETTWKQAQYDLITIKKQCATLYRELLSKSGYPENLS